MIKLLDKKECCGCTACQQICPMHCIQMQEDTEGFFYPITNEEKCTNCGLCEKVCPVRHPFKRTINEPSSFACKSNDASIVENSSSGGMFSVFAQKIIADNGVVFGARFSDRWEVIHDYTETLEGISAFRGSKYVQSQIGDSFAKVKFFLEKGRKVLFTGTPCQITGLHHYLRKQYDNLYTIDFVCHSISSPKVWNLYLEDVRNQKLVKKVTFRDKSQGWRNYSLKIQGENTDGSSITLDYGKQTENLYMRGFLEGLTTRPSCSHCPARNYVTHSDLMLADCWHLEKYHPDWDDNKGMSLVLILSEKGQQLFNLIQTEIFARKIPYSEVEDCGVHAPITHSSAEHPYRSHFFRDLTKTESAKYLINKYLKKNDQKKAIHKALMKTIHLLPGFNHIKTKLIKKRKNK